jgi:hypothetical protein
MLSCFQVDPESGRIVIDGIDISTIGVHDLRSRLVCSRIANAYLVTLMLLSLDIHSAGKCNTTA